jgi:hypothetical protein
MRRTLRWVIPLCLFGTALVFFATAQEAEFVIKAEKTAVPKDVNESIAKLLSSEAVRFLDAKENLICEVWLRKDVPSEATDAQVKNGLTYRELKETTVLGVVRVAQNWIDYRKQKVKAGVYTLRLGFQPMDGDHSGTSDSLDFCVLVKADKDTKPDLMEPKALIEASMKSIETGHPAVFMLFPNSKPGDKPQLAKRTSKDNPHWVLNAKQDVLVGGKQKSSIGIGLTLVGHGE